MIAIFLAAALSGLTSLVGTQFLVRLLRARRIGQPVREEGPKGHVTKAGTPTMGGVAIVGAAFVGYLGAHLRSDTIFTRSGLLVMLAIGGAAAVGLVDDWIKVSRERNLGLNKTAKIVGLLLVAVGFALGAMFAGRSAPACEPPIDPAAPCSLHTNLSFTRFDSLGFDLGTVGWVVFAVLLILATSNAVNLTDGLDGLAAGSAGFGFVAYVVVGFWAFRHPEIYDIAHSLDIGIAAAAMLGACIGFLWWNAHPARIIMGDTGSLALGTGLAALALLTNTHLLLGIIGGLYVLETVSVILQVGAFRLFRRRVFRMAPIHHHFELGGWPEPTVIVRLWILAGLGVGLALGLYYADFITTGALD
ncbi:MAG: phospho-N-acetylmuramoyl-pentapeptide-transferase [Acidimicrobiales bacterium]